MANICIDICGGLLDKISYLRIQCLHTKLNSQKTPPSPRVMGASHLGYIEASHPYVLQPLSYRSTIAISSKARLYRTNAMIKTKNGNHAFPDIRLTSSISYLANKPVA